MDNKQPHKGNKRCKMKNKNDIFKCDCHVHPDYSIDARGRAEEFVKEAIRKGLKRICFTTHIDLDPILSTYDPYIRFRGRLYRLADEYIIEYKNELINLKKIYEGRIEVIWGFEFSYGLHFEQKIRDFVEKFRPEFTIGSIHALDGIEITSSEFKDLASRIFEINSFIPKYYDMIVSLAASGIFDVVGHIDGYKKYLGLYWGISRCEELEAKFLPQIAAELKALNMPIELNTAGLRRELKSTYPSETALKILLEHGVRVATVGSDAHSPEQVGEGFDIAEELLKGVIYD
ncbi:MAG TPA: histidinol-phosphatase HisJ family protein [candidate division Zixibacteria bacterium]|nr:histidinol-phosphatase HisJ family protein [candidate division Zixibacteria bacterium]